MNEQWRDRTVEGFLLGCIGSQPLCEQTWGVSTYDPRAARAAHYMLIHYAPDFPEDTYENADMIFRYYKVALLGTLRH